MMHKILLFRNVICNILWEFSKFEEQMNSILLVLAIIYNIYN